MQYNKIMCLDYGDARIGIAFSDFLQITANPFEVYLSKGWQKDIEYISALANANSANLIVIGMPYSLDGSENERTQITKNFAKDLSDFSKIKVEFEDERLSSHEAEEILRERRVPPKERKKQLDMLSAAIILEAYLTRKKGD